MAQARYQKNVDKIAEQISRGELKPRARFTIHRAFAKQEGISLVTVSQVYRELTEKGLVSGENNKISHSLYGGLRIKHKKFDVFYRINV
ncbi:MULTISPECIES: GntR family transcriptional regulator [Providencia]|uniref:GntR family transcriptional regulator n=1 Tax=Providencia huaxiensis TaxID=2027290 RepID=A0ABU2IXL8_9GAMM|nr:MULTISPECIES: GntR family transcriptional regulator [Providencia]MBN6361438.1 GntR family transcriptional regulator [Providencia huaxiensis]MBQ0533847.1 GntR family transcriptional regulator [Providencia huaxiensis]MBQ0588541.1 GntR family transcriptional regulator [Providencia huaxiensis]MBZ3680515.1 GntR family transcriptional regulator [Providencia rettgeri]MCD2527801.1 GntR family transcriptional regulator [Providencia huaxiensis]